MAGGNCTINMGACQKCGKCKEVCPHGAVQKNGETYWIDHALCNGCLMCKNSCPHYAISFTPDSQSNLGENEPTGLGSW